MIAHVPSSAVHSERAVDINSHRLHQLVHLNPLIGGVRLGDVARPEYDGRDAPSGRKLASVGAEGDAYGARTAKQGRPRPKRRLDEWRVGLSLQRVIHHERLM